MSNQTASRYSRGYLGATSCGAAALASHWGCCRRLGWIGYQAEQGTGESGMACQATLRPERWRSSGPLPKGTPLIERKSVAR